MATKRLQKVSICRGGGILLLVGLGGGGGDDVVWYRGLKFRQGAFIFDFWVSDGLRLMSCCLADGTDDGNVEMAGVSSNERAVCLPAGRWSRRR